jgi:2-polyprenyl-3-methyl-5-hydroxy-6-metoxy-1,4-benzoquinol methylase
MAKIANIIKTVADKHPIHGRKLSKTLTQLDDVYNQRAEKFLGQYEAILAESGKDLNYAINCYLKFIADITAESVRFRETGKYSATSFAEVDRLVYNNPEVMEYHTHALLLSQFLWRHHYQMFCFFSEELKSRSESVKSYLEIGGGHGLQVSEAVRILGQKSSFTVVDISPTSLNLAKRLVADTRVKFIQSDIFQYGPGEKYDFITMGEVLEHLEDPRALLKHVSGLLAEDGVLFITTPTNAPTIDHIYLFRNADDIRNLIQQSGLTVVSEFSRYAEEVSPEIAEKFKITLHYGACLKKSRT